jgi:hypothetical protein
VSPSQFLVAGDELFDSLNCNYCAKNSSGNSLTSQLAEEEEKNIKKSCGWVIILFRKLEALQKKKRRYILMYH